MSPEDYDLFVTECDIKSPRLFDSQNGIVAHDPQAGCDQPVIQILSDHEEAAQLLDAARRLYPKAMPAIRQGMETRAPSKCQVNTEPKQSTQLLEPGGKLLGRRDESGMMKIEGRRAVIFSCALQRDPCKTTMD